MKISTEVWNEMLKTKHDNERTRNAIIKLVKKYYDSTEPISKYITECFKSYYDNTLPKEIKDEIDEIKKNEINKIKEELGMID